VEPPLGWLETIYGDEPFPKRHGLHFAPCAFTADNVIVKGGPLLLGNDDYLSIHGLRFWLFGFEFTLALPHRPPAEDLSMPILTNLLSEFESGASAIGLTLG
jgi:hypothetical protein